MLGALLTTVFFSLSAILATRSIRLVGATTANLGRLVVAFLCLGLYAFTFGQGFRGAGLNWFLLSGVIGMGLGDLALFATLPRLGSRLSVLITQCMAVPIAMLAERVWLGTRLAGAEILWAVVILTGVAIALTPSRSRPPQVPLRPSGFIFGLLSAAGQGLGAVVSRRAYSVSEYNVETIDGVTAAFQRISGGLVISALFFLALHVWSRRSASPSSRSAAPLPSRANRSAWLIVSANALAGPVLGVSCYQWALASTPSGIVLPIVATTPLVIIPLSMWLEGEKPTRQSVIGGVVAVCGVVALALVH